MPSVKQYKVYEQCADFFWNKLLRYLSFKDSHQRFINSADLLDQLESNFCVLSNDKKFTKLLKSFYKLKMVQVTVEMTANAREYYHQTFTIDTEDEGHRKMRLRWNTISQKCKLMLKELESKYSVYLTVTSNKKRLISYKKQPISRKGIRTSSPVLSKPLKPQTSTIDFEKLINYQSRKESGWLSLIMSEENSYMPISKIVTKVNSIGNKSYFRSLKLGKCIDFDVLEPKIEFNQPADDYQDYAIIVVSSSEINFALKLYTDIDELIGSLRLCDNLYLDFLNLTDDVIGDYQEILLKSESNYKHVRDFNWYSLCIFLRTLLTFKAHSFSEICSIDVKIIPLLGKLFLKRSCFLKKDDHSALQGYLASLLTIYFKVNYAISKISRNCTSDVNLRSKTDFKDQIKSNSFSLRDESLSNVGIFIKRAPNKRIPMWFFPVLIVKNHRFVMFRTQNIDTVNIIRKTETGEMKIEVYCCQGYDLDSDGCILNTKTKRLECIKSANMGLRSLKSEERYLTIKSIINYHLIHHETQFTFNINGLDREYPLLHLRMDVASQERLKPIHMNTLLHSTDKQVQSLESFGLKYY